MTATPVRPLLPGAVASAASGLLLAVAFPSLDLGPLALVALVPLLWAWRDAGPGRAALYGFTAGLAFFAVHIWWIWYFGVVAIVPLLLVQAAYWAGAGAVIGWLGRLRIRSPWLVAATWVVFEALRTRWPLGGLAWGQAGVALHDLPLARFLASLGGVPLVSFVVVLVNGLLLEIVLGWRARAASRQPLTRAVGLLGAVVLVVPLAAAFRSEPASVGTLRFAMLQGNDQNRLLTAEEIASGYLTRKHLALARTLRGTYDLIVFPESALETDPEADPGLKAELLRLARRYDAAVLVNVLDEQTPGKLYNANRLYDPKGRLQDTYAKRHLVPFGEYVPWRDQLSFVKETAQIPRDQTPGNRTVVFDVAGTRVGTAICFESAFGPLMRTSVRDGADAVVVTTNNRSYRRSPNSAQHLELTQMNAAAIGRPVLQASISGISAVIDATGNVSGTTDLFRNTVVTGTIATTTGQTPYVRYGDWVEWASLLGLAGAVALALARRRLAAPVGEATPVDRQPQGSHA